MTDLRKQLEALVEREAFNYANQFVAKPRKELEPWQEEKANDHRAGAHLLLDAVVEMQEAMDKILWTHVQGISADRIVQQTNIDNLNFCKQVAREALASFEKRLSVNTEKRGE